MAGRDVEVIDRPKILIICQQGVGDLILALPLLLSVRQAVEGPEQIAVLVRSDLEAGVFKLFPAFDGTTVLSWRTLGLLRSLWQIRNIGPEVVLAPHSNEKSKHPLFCRLLGAKKTVIADGKWSRILGFRHRLSPIEGEHKVTYFLRYGKNLGIDSKCVDQSFLARIVSDADRLPPGDQLKKDLRWIILGPGSGEIEKHKRWPPAFYSKLGELLINHSQELGVAIMGGESERELLLSISRGISSDPRRCVVLASSDLARSVAVLREAACLVAADSGIGHIAALAGVPIVGLFGPGNPGFTVPFSDKLRVVRLNLECAPCYRIGFITGCGNPICMSMLEPDTVFSAVIDTLEGGPVPPIPWLSPTTATQPSMPQKA